MGGRRSGPRLETLRAGTPAALFATNDPLTVGGFGEFRISWLSVSCDVSVIGFNNSPATQFELPRLTTGPQNVVE